MKTTLPANSEKCALYLCILVVCNLVRERGKFGNRPVFVGYIVSDFCRIVPELPVVFSSVFT